MQTPVDPHWRDEATRITSKDDTDRRREVAHRYLQACHDAKLEVIAVTDHNFASQASVSLINELRSENDAVAGMLGRQPLVIFPGFEIEANVGIGCHVLCLFPPDTPLDVVDARLTALGLPPDARFDGSAPRPTAKSLADVIRVVQDDSQFSGVVIAAHPTSSQGLFDNDRIAEWLQREEFVNPALLCLEVPKPPRLMSQGWQRLLNAGPDCEATWRRRRAIACIMSSDCYRLTPTSETDTNFIGHRSTWIRMTDPSIEALRQAFLDHASRIHLEEVSPDALSAHPRIIRASISGMTFLKRTESIAFSPNLNCIIGSRGTGKSSLVDYVRLALDRLRADDIAPGIRDEVLDRVHGTMTDASRVEVEIETAGGVYRVVCAGRTPTRSVLLGNEPQTQIDIRTLFPARFLSQREIDQSFGKRDAATMRRLLDEFVATELRVLREQAENLQGEIRLLDTQLATLKERQARQRALQTELMDLQGQLSRQEALNSVLPNWNRMEVENRALETIAREIQTTRERVLGLAQDMKALDWSGNPHRVGDASPPYAQAVEVARQAVDSLTAALMIADGAFAGKLQGEDSPFDVARRQWRAEYERVRSEFEAARDATQPAQAAGPDPTSIPQRILEVESQLAELSAEAARIPAAVAARTAKVAQLRQVWHAETSVRTAKATSITDRLRPPGQVRSLVEISIAHQGEVSELAALLIERNSDRRRLSDSELHSVAEAVANKGGEDLLRAFLDDAGLDDGVVAATLGRRMPAFREMFSDDALRELEGHRISDSISYMVYRADGTLAGPIERVSAGQQGTAILNILLAEGTSPLIVDTPEEGLDSEGVFAELVPLFRREKRRRQILVVTHNANIPVNADAESIIALEARGFVDREDVEKISGGVIHFDEDRLRRVETAVRSPSWQADVAKVVGEGVPSEQLDRFLTDLAGLRTAESVVRTDSAGAPAIGGLDRLQVKRAVQDIMEGSEDAFRRRNEMYGF